MRPAQRELDGGCKGCGAVCPRPIEARDFPRLEVVNRALRRHRSGSMDQKARTKGLGLSDMQGGCFTISSLGGIGGTAFTPIINAPEVAILGVSKSQVKPVYGSDQQLQPQLTLPLSLSYDHRVIDGAEGARFMVYLSDRLADIRTLLL